MWTYTWLRACRVWKTSLAVQYAVAAAWVAAPRAAVTMLDANSVGLQPTHTNISTSTLKITTHIH